MIATCTLAAAPREAAAQAPPDGIWGRLRADAVFSLEAGGGVAVVADAARPVVSGVFRVRALDTAGLFAAYQYAFVGPRYDALALGVELRPLMLARIFSDAEHGPRWVNLMLDSIGIELGGAWIRPGDPWGAGSGAGFHLGGGVELPFAWNEGNGLAVRLGVRWTHATGFDAQGPAAAAGATTSGGAPPPAGESVAFTLSLVGRVMARLGLVSER